MPKIRGELLITGHAYPRGGEKPACSVRARLGSIDKTLYVVGNRYWKGGAPSDPQPFSKIAISYENAFGGAGYAENPVGKGSTPTQTDAGELHFLPNLEDPKHLLRSPKERPALPSGFGPYDLTWPQRNSEAGFPIRRGLAQGPLPGARPRLRPGFLQCGPDRSAHRRVLPRQRDLHAREHAPVRARALRSPPRRRGPRLREPRDRSIRIGRDRHAGGHGPPLSSHRAWDRSLQGHAQDRGRGCVGRPPPRRRVRGSRRAQTRDPLRARPRGTHGSREGAPLRPQGRRSPSCVDGGQRTRHRGRRHDGAPSIGAALREEHSPAYGDRAREDAGRASKPRPEPRRAHPHGPASGARVASP